MLTHKNVPKELITQTSEVADIRKGSGHSSDVTDKTIAAVRGVEAFSLVCRNRPVQVQAPHSALR